MLIPQIDPTIIVAIIGVVGAILSVGLPYVFTRNKEVELSVRQEKTQRYDGLIEALVMIGNEFVTDKGYVTHGLTPNTFNTFIATYNRASTYANDDVLRNCNSLVDALMRGKRNTNRILGDITSIYQAIRLDINPKAKAEFVGFWRGSEANI
jgi:hypothetical protein